MASTSKPDPDKLWLSHTLSLATSVSSYCQHHSTPLPPSIESIRLSANADPSLAKHTIYFISTLEAQMLKVLAGLLNVKRVLEIGCFVGYSAAMWASVSEETKVVTLELNEEFASAAEKNFERLGIGERVQVIRGDAAQSLASLPLPTTKEEQFDLAFIDADKPGYLTYYKLIRDRGLVKKGGLILCDNVLRRGLVASDESPFKGDEKLEKEAVLMREFNTFVVEEDTGVEAVMLPLFDGLTMVRVK